MSEGSSSEQSIKTDHCSSCWDEFEEHDLYGCGSCGDGPYCIKCKEHYLVQYKLGNSDYARDCFSCNKKND